MEMDLNGIINKIKEEGVGEAEKNAVAIISRAREEAIDIVEAAKKEKEEIIKTARQEAERLQKNGEEAIKQASRDVVLSLKDKITALFDSIIKREVASNLQVDWLREMITHLVKNFKTDDTFEVEVLLSEKDKQYLEKSVFAELKGKMAEGVTLKVSPNVENGFRIGEKGKNSFYDFTDEAITEAFKTFLNPKITEILK